MLWGWGIVGCFFWFVFWLGSVTFLAWCLATLLQLCSSVCLHPFFYYMDCVINLKLHMGIENCHMQRLTKLFVSFTCTAGACFV